MADDKLEAARDEGDHQLSNSRNIISRDEANALGLKRYFTGVPCKHGHIAEPSVRWGRETRRKHRAANLEKLREKDREANRKQYIKNRDKIRSKQAAWRAENKEKIAAYRRQWYAKNKDRVRSKQAA